MTSWLNIWLAHLSRHLPLSPAQVTSPGLHHVISLLCLCSRHLPLISWQCCNFARFFCCMSVWLLLWRQVAPPPVHTQKTTDQKSAAKLQHVKITLPVKTKQFVVFQELGHDVTSQFAEVRGPSDLIQPGFQGQLHHVMRPQFWVKGKLLQHMPVRRGGSSGSVEPPQIPT